ncbi:MAG: lysophospholipase [Omnitrophica bacterium]|nr:lysophospholipase [Candidatus Omnitrophota bacterium]
MFETKEGLRLFEKFERPKGNARALIVIVHGYGEHSGRYGHVVRRLVNAGYAVYVFDLRGHGRSSGARVFVRSFNEYLSDLEAYLTRVGEREPGRPLFILGHSLGGAIATLFAIDKKPDISGLILSGPLLKLPGNISPLFIRLASLIGCILPKLPIGNKVLASLLSHDSKVVENYEKDPLTHHGGIPAGSARAINCALKRIQNGMAGISLPLLIMHGTDDRLADVKGSKELYRCARSTDKTLRLYDGFYHEILNELGKEKPINEIITWLNKRTRWRRGIS